MNKKMILMALVGTIGNFAYADTARISQIEDADFQITMLEKAEKAAKLKVSIDELTGKKKAKVDENLPPVIPESKLLFDSARLLSTWGSGETRNVKIATNRGTSINKVGDRLATGEVVKSIGHGSVTLIRTEKKKEVTRTLGVTGEDYSVQQTIVVQPASAAQQPATQQQQAKPVNAATLPPIVPYDPAKMFGNNPSTTQPQDNKPKGL